MASTDQVMTKIQLVKNATPPSVAGGSEKPARLLQSIEEGRRKGRKTSAVSGTIATTPSRVAKPAPSRMPR